MSRKTITLEVDGPAQEQLICNYHALLMELNDLALTAADGSVMDQLEELAVQRGRETLRASLEQAVQKRIEDAEKMGRRSASVLAVTNARTAARASGNGLIVWGN